MPVVWLQARITTARMNGMTYFFWRSESVAAAFFAFSAAAASSAAIISARISFAFSSPLFAASEASASSLRPFR